MSAEAEQARRRHQRYAAVLEVRVPSVGELETFFTRDVSRGGTFLYTDLDVREGQELFLEIVHPESQELFGVKSRVIRRVVERGTCGVGVEFVELDEAKRSEFWDFIHSALPLHDDDILIIEDTDLWSELSPDTVRAAAAMGDAYPSTGS